MYLRKLEWLYYLDNYIMIVPCNPLQALVNQQEKAIHELEINNEAAVKELSIHLDKEAQSKENEYLRKMDENKQKMINAKSQKLSAQLDATALTEEHKKQVC